MIVSNTRHQYYYLMQYREMNTKSCAYKELPLIMYCIRLFLIMWREDMAKIPEQNDEAVVERTEDAIKHIDNHLAYADETIIFAFTDRYSLNKIVTTLQKYEAQSGQKVKKEKSFLYATKCYNKT